ncbi:DUF4373 domain-containing protein [Paenibacillus gansuensis]|uniref:DUF4373 domain-containing protein n=1 Tax=Paenibacillus gansuensis TaxID=306542 RepID=A0ABW5PEW6_9BACL
MARPVKEGLEYFPLDVDIDQDDKLLVVIGKFGMEGFGIIIRLMSEIYKNGYFHLWEEREQYVFAKRVNVDINKVNDIVNECIKWGFFHQELFEKHHILTSKGFQSRYIGASKRRKSIVFIDEYTLIDLGVACQKVISPIHLVNANGNVINVYINPSKRSESDTESTQIEKEIEKEKESKKKILKKPSRQQKTYAEDDRYLLMAKYLFERIMASAEQLGKGHLVRDADMQKWADEFRKLVELDKAVPDEIKRVINWVTSDPFWQKNILSAKKLREKYKDLAMKMPSGNHPAVAGKSKQQLRNEEAVRKIREAEQRERERSAQALPGH